MVRNMFVAASLLAFGGCAQVTEGPSYAGLAGLANDRADERTDDSATALRHVQSNKILGAMAFQKVTGQTVDPSSLSGRE